MNDKNFVLLWCKECKMFYALWDKEGVKPVCNHDTEKVKQFHKEHLEG